MKIIIFLFTAFMFSGNLFSQWLADVRITNDSAHSYTCFNGSRGVTANGNYVHIVWFDDRNGALNREIYYKRSTNSGASFEADVRLTNNASHSFHACVESAGSIVHVIWQDLRDGNDEVYYKRSSDNGATWGTDVRLTNAPNWSQFPSLSVSGLNVHVVWDDYRNNNDEIYYKRSTDAGLTWEGDARLTNNTLNSWNPSVSSAGSVIYCVWQDSRDGNFEIYGKLSADGGVTWGTDTRVTNNSSAQVEPCVSVSGLNIHVAWKDSRDSGNLEIYYNRSTDGGASWGTDMRMTATAGQTWYPSIWASGDNIHLVWNDYTGVPEIYYNYSTNGGATWGTIQRLTSHTLGGAFRPSVYVQQPAIYVAWVDTRDLGAEEIYYKRNPTGIQAVNQISSQLPKKFILHQNYPNPFNPVTNIEFAVPKSSFVKMIVYDVLGKEIAILVNENLKAGTYNADWNASKYPSGVYFYKLVTEGFSETKKMVLIK
jgi:hypothetical protein